MVAELLRRYIPSVHSSLVFGISLSISGRNRNDVKDMLYQDFDYALTREVYWDDAKQRYVWAGTD